MTNKEICFKYEEIADKAIEIAKTRGDYDWLQTNIEIQQDGLKVVFEDAVKDEWIKDEFITWEDLND